MTALPLNLSASITAQGYAAAVNNVPDANGFKINLTKIQPVVAGVPQGYFTATGVSLGDGQVRIRASVTSEAAEYGYDEVWIYDGNSNEVFCKVKRADGGILDYVSPYKRSVINYNIKFTTLPAGTVTILADTDQSIALAALDAHIEADNLRFGSYAGYTLVNNGNLSLTSANLNHFVFIGAIGGDVVLPDVTHAPIGSTITIANQSGYTRTVSIAPGTNGIFMAGNGTGAANFKLHHQNTATLAHRGGGTWIMVSGTATNQFAFLSDSRFGSITTSTPQNGAFVPNAVPLLFTAARSGVVSLSITVSFFQAVNLSFVYLSFLKNGVGAPPSIQRHFPNTPTGAYQSAECTRLAIDVQQGDLFHLSIGTGSPSTGNYFAEIKYED